MWHGVTPDPWSSRSQPTRTRSITDPLEDVLDELAAEDLGEAPRRDIVAAIEEMVAHPEYPCLGAA